MSAIFGIFRYDGEPAASSDLERMGNTLRHRGPDGREFVVDGCFGAGHCLMRVNHEDRFEAQPIYDAEAGLTLVADCRIDNREALALAFGLSDGELSGLPDSDLILRAYAQWGEACAEHLLGDFAFAIWDARAGKLVIGRDHMGQRNLFYHQGQHFLAFASEIKGLWALADTPRQLVDEEIARFFHGTLEQRAEGATLYAGISGLPGGTVAVAGQDRTIRLRQYWAPRADPVHENRDESYYVERYRSVLAEAVDCRLRRLNRPAALLMSAGFDTAAIAGLARPAVDAQGRKLISLCWLGEESAKVTRGGDIRPWVEACRRAMPHLDVRELWQRKTAPLAGIERVFLAHDGPGGGSRRTSTLLFAAAAEAGARLIMDGFGGDYTLNPRGHGALARHLRNGQFRRFLAEVRPHLRATGQSPWRLLKHEVVLMLLPRAVIRWQRRVRRLGSHAWNTSAQRAMEGPYLAALRERDPTRAGSAEAIPLTAMRETIRQMADKIRRGPSAAFAGPAAAHGLELTRPFHDVRVVEFALAVPEDLYVKNGLNRYLARRALADIYPPEFQTRGRKNEGALGDTPILDFGSPELLAEADRLAPSERLSRYFNFERAARILANPARAGQAAADKNAVYRALLTSRFIEWFGGANAP